MSRACRALLITLIGLGSGALGVRAAHADKLRILVLDVEGPSLTPASRSTLAQGLMTGLGASGVDAVRAADVASPGSTGRGCADASCWGRLLASPATAPAYVVRSSISMAGSTYQLRVEMLDPRTSKVLEAREDACEICTDAEAAEALGMTASAVKVAVTKRRREAAGAAAGRPAGAKAARLATPTAAATVGVAQPTSGVGATAGADISGDAGGKQETGAPRSGARAIAGWALLGAGALAIVAGIVLVRKDGGGACDGKNTSDASWCPEKYSTQGAGIAAIGLGVAAGAVGGWFLATGPTTRDGQVALASGWSLALKRAF